MDYQYFCHDLMSGSCCEWILWGQFGVETVSGAVGLCPSQQTLLYLTWNIPRRIFKSVYNHSNLSAARLEQIIVIYLIEN